MRHIEQRRGQLGRRILDRDDAIGKAGDQADRDRLVESDRRWADLARADAVLAMYHDQGLPVLKHASFGRGVNITLGLPIIRTSVDHGTALDLAAQGLGHADHGSMVEAIRTAARMAAAQNSKAQ